MSDLLSNAITAFAQWCSNKLVKHSPISRHLQEQVVALLPHYPRSKITSSLRISGGQLKQWRGAHQVPTESDDFVELPLSPT